ncbi:hypothetical protein [uncultured Corynebacterium sp.]|uniref:hypothetical protein n=1 Tax=uncultured Corynebacterium sp. TaxID=159447 RepID=UPI0025D3C553|nr:hypothetical protein [uncultured Corynebacterium sp.]
MNTDNSTPSFDAPPTGIPMSGNPWQQPTQPEIVPQRASPRKTRGLLVGGAAAAALAGGLGAGYYLADDGDSEPSQVATYAGDLGAINSVLGSFGQEGTLPASFASSLVQCRQSPGIVQGQGNAVADAATCSMVLNGYRGEMVYTRDAEWIADMRDDRGELPDYRVLDIPGFDAFTYTDRMSGADFPVTVLVDPEGTFYLDVTPRGIEEHMAPTTDEIGGFGAAVAEALRA